MELDLAAPPGPIIDRPFPRAEAEVEIASGGRHPDCQLMERVATGEETAVEELYRRVAGSMLVLARSILRSRSEAEDVVQWSFCQIWRRADRFRASRGSVAAWMATIVRRRAIDVLRMRRGQYRASALLRWSEDIVTIAGGPELLACAESRKDVRIAIGTLMDAERQAIRLSFFGGLTHDQIARRLNTPVGTVKARIRRGLIKLRPVLADLAHPRGCF